MNAIIKWKINQKWFQLFFLVSLLQKGWHEKESICRYYSRICFLRTMLRTSSMLVSPDTFYDRVDTLRMEIGFLFLLFFRTLMIWCTGRVYCFMFVSKALCRKMMTPLFNLAVHQLALLTNVLSIIFLYMPYISFLLILPFIFLAIDIENIP